jgi:CBS domain-containing protein
MKALDLMTRKTATVRADDSVLSAIRLMLDNNVSGLPVIDDKCKLVGIVTEGDLLRRAELATEKQRSWWRALLMSSGKLAKEYVHTHAHLVRDIMTTPVRTVDFDTPIEVAVDMMEKFNIKRLPVVRGTTLVGILSRRDLLRAAYWLVTEPSDTAHPHIADGEITANITEQLGRQRWTSSNCVQARVQDGNVELCGVIFDERERSALRVLVESVPGVVAIRDHLVYVEPNSGFVFAPSASAVGGN